MQANKKNGSERGGRLGFDEIAQKTHHAIKATVYFQQHPIDDDDGFSSSSSSLLTQLFDDDDRSRHRSSRS
jgi:hypothetical protein